MNTKVFGNTISEIAENIATSAKGFRWSNLDNVIDDVKNFKFKDLENSNYEKLKNIRKNLSQIDIRDVNSTNITYNKVMSKFGPEDYKAKSFLDEVSDVMGQKIELNTEEMKLMIPEGKEEAFQEAKNTVLGTRTRNAEEALVKALHEDKNALSGYHVSASEYFNDEVKGGSRRVMAGVTGLGLAGGIIHHNREKDISGGRPW